MTCTAKDERIVLCLYGPRGGTQFLGGLTRDGAIALVGSLNTALRELDGRPERLIAIVEKA